MEPTQNPLFRSLAPVRSKRANANLEDSPQPFPLMKLLPELRIRIYEYVFEDLALSIVPVALSTLQNLSEHLRPRLKRFLALLHTARVLRIECIEVYCRVAKAHLAVLARIIGSFYKRSNPNLMMLADLHAREMAMGKLESLLCVVRLVMSGGAGQQRSSFAALKASMGVKDADQMIDASG